MSKEKEDLVFVSRHEPSEGQVAIARELGYSGITQIPVTFTDDPVADLKSAGIEEKEIAIVAPSHTTNTLLNEGYTLIEFSPVRREGEFLCGGAYKFTLSVKIYENSRPVQADARIEQEFIPCPISLEEQTEDD